MRWILALVLSAVLSGGMAHAQGAETAEGIGFPVDYEALFAAHADRVQTPEPDVRHLELPGPVIVTARSENGGTSYGTAYYATDMSGQGAVMCAMKVMVDVLILAGHCPGLLDDASIHRLEQMIHAHGLFAAQNTYPPVPKDQVGPRLRAMVRARDAEMAGITCPVPNAPDDQIATMAQSISSEAAMGRAAKSLAKPRLPVMNPCL